MHTFVRRIVGILAIVLVSLLGAGTPKAMIIFDASGSMWGQIDGVNKIVIARDALKSVVGKWNPKVQLGLTVYGHRVKGDCNDIQTVIPIGPVHKKQMIDTVMGILPKGMTPIAKSLRQVANSLRQYEDQTTIILISDGKESCDADPCATAKQLKAEGINFVAHVVGFNVNAATDRQLACIAHATGGEYFSAKNAAALNKAIKVIAKKVEKPKPKKPVSQNTTLELIARLNMSPTALNVSGMQWKATQKGKILYSGDKEAPKVPAKVGKVHIEATYARTSDVQKVAGDVTLKPKKNNPVIIQLKSGKVTIDTAEEQGDPKVKSSVRIYPVLNGQPNMSDEIAWCVPTKSKACERALPTGDFLIQAAYNGMTAKKQITLGNKEKKSIHLYFKQTGQVYATASETEGGKLVDASCHLMNDKEESWYLGARKRNPQSTAKQFPVGHYTLKCNYNEFSKKDIPVEIQAGKMQHIHVVFGQTGQVYVTARETPKGKLVEASCRLYYKDRHDNWYISVKRKHPESTAKQVPVGEYTLDCSYNSITKKDIPVAVKAGKATRVEVVFGQTGEVFVSASERKGGKWINGNCDIYNQDESENWRVDPTRRRDSSINHKRLAAGHYTLKCDHNGFQKKNIPVEIKPGEATKVHVIFPFFYLSSTCLHPSDGVHYEIYASSGELVYEKSTSCSQKLKVTLDEGAYTIEGKIKAARATTKITVTNGENSAAVLDFTRQKPAETPQPATPATSSPAPQSTSTTPIVPKPVQQKIQDLNQAADAITKTVNDHKDDLKKMGDLLNALGGLMGGKQKATAHTQSSPKNTTELNVSDDDLQLFSK